MGDEAGEIEGGVQRRIGAAEGGAVEVDAERQVDEAVLPVGAEFVGRDGDRGEGAGGFGLEEAEALGKFAGDEAAQRHVVAEQDQLDVEGGLFLADAHRHVIGDHRDLAFHVEAPGGIAQRDRIAGAEETVRAALIHQGVVVETLGHRVAARGADEFDMVDIGRTIRPLIGARQRAFAVMLVEAEGGDRAELHLPRQRFQLRAVDVPLVERGLQRRRDAGGIGGARQVAADDDEAAIARAVAEGGEFHGGVSFDLF